MKHPKKPPAPRAESATISGSHSASAGAAFCLILCAAFVAYLPSLSGGLLWDDAGHITHPGLRSWSGLARIWFEPGATQQYYPLLHSVFWIEHCLWGDATIAYHLVNVLWHAIAATLLVALLRRLAVPGAMLAGLLFALHPVGVESVAWISEQKNTLSTVFYLAAALAWLRYEEHRGHAGYAVAFAWFGAALLTKTVTATLPAALMVVAWWRSGRLTWRGSVLPLLPWLALGLGAGGGTAWLEADHIGAKGEDFALGAVERVLLAGRVVWFYLGKLLWPTELAFFYPRWTIDASSAWQWLFPLTALLVLAAAIWWSRRDRGPLAALLLYGGTLVPALGFVNVYPFLFSYVADHFQYLASLWMLAFLAAAAARGFPRLGWPQGSGPALAAGVLLLLGGLTWRQSSTYRDEITLYQSTLAKNPSSWVAQLNLGTVLCNAGRVEESLPHLQRALELKPDYPETLNSLGDVLNQLGRSREARPLLERAVQIRPRFAVAHNTLGATLMALGQPAEGITQFQRALDLEPNLFVARVNLGWALANRGDLARGLAELERVRREEPPLADVEFKIGVILGRSGRVADAIAPLSRAVELQPENTEMQYVLGCALVEAGRTAEAVTQFKEILNGNPHHAGARQMLEFLRRPGATPR